MKKNIVLGVTGGIASYKMPNVASALTQRGYNVRVCMTKKATEFITPFSFEALTKNICVLEDSMRIEKSYNQHITLGSQADIYMIAPATANTIAKLAAGIADNIVTEVALVATCPILIAPAMNTRMLTNPATMENIEILRKRGFHIIDPAFGNLACGDVGGGRLAEPSELVEIVEYFANKGDNLKGKKILINAGPTREAIDPVRFISNNSTGKMGYALAKAAISRGAEVVLISGKTNLEKPQYLSKYIEAVRADDMYKAVIKEIKDKDAIILSAAVADYTPKEYSTSKLKKACFSGEIKLARTKDILEEVCKLKENKTWVCGFAMETENVVENATKKLNEKNADMIVANSLSIDGAGFGGDTNVATLIDKGGIKSFEKMSKLELANIILDAIK